MTMRERESKPNGFFKPEWTALHAFKDGPVIVTVYASNHRTPNHRIDVSFLGNNGAARSFQPKYTVDARTKTVEMQRAAPIVAKLYAEAEELVYQEKIKNVASR